MAENMAKYKGRHMKSLNINKWQDSEISCHSKALGVLAAEPAIRSPVPVEPETLPRRNSTQASIKLPAKRSMDHFENGAVSQSGEKKTKGFSRYSNRASQGNYLENREICTIDTYNTNSIRADHDIALGVHEECVLLPSETHSRACDSLTMTGEESTPSVKYFREGPTPVAATAVTAHEDELDEGIDDQDFLTLNDSFAADSSDYEDGISDKDLVEIADIVNPVSTSSKLNKPSFPKLSWGIPKDCSQTRPESKLSVAESPSRSEFLVRSLPASQLLSPLSFSAPLLPSQETFKAPTSGITASQESAPPRHIVPFLSPTAPNRVACHSPIPGLSSRLCIVTHFRLGPALNYCTALSQEARSSETIIELYARVLSSHRDGSRQLFQLADLFHYDRPPYLSAEWIGWQGLPYFTLDGDAFLRDMQSRKICRAVGRIERRGPLCWRMCILSIWEASWDDIDVVKGIMSV